MKVSSFRRTVSIANFSCRVSSALSDQSSFFFKSWTESLAKPLSFSEMTVHFSGLSSLWNALYFWEGLRDNEFIWKPYNGLLLFLLLNAKQRYPSAKSLLLDGYMILLYFWRCSHNGLQYKKFTPESELKTNIQTPQCEKTATGQNNTSPKQLRKAKQFWLKMSFKQQERNYTKLDAKHCVLGQNMLHKETTTEVTLCEHIYGTAYYHQ